MPRESSSSGEPETATALPGWQGTMLLRGIANQKEESLEALYRACGDRFYSMALHWVRDEGMALEVVQDCFVRIWKKADRYDPARSAPFTWCCMILRGICLDHLRKNRRNPILLVSEEGHYYDSSSGFLWQPASDGGGYLGSLAPEGLDLTAFNEPEPAPDHANDTEIREAMASVPEGYLIEGDNGEAPVFIFNGVVSADQAISLRQGNNSVPLAPDPPITDAHGSANDSSSETQNSIAGNLVPSFIFGLPPQASASVDFSQPFEVITTDPNGQQSVILTTGP